MAETKGIDDITNAFRQMAVGVDDINVLLLGETGIGKSTFINAFTNYLHYKSFDVAEKADVKCLVPAKFEITDDKDGHFVKKTISIGEDLNENTSIVSAATQTARSYVFPLPDYNSRNLRLIDTPGICDDRGIEQDKTNLENILSYIGKIEQLHAICILLKPNNARLTVAFQYCITQLLSRLEKSAGNNIVFVFTNSRSTFYKPGDTSAAVVRILDLIAQNPPHVKIRFEKENVFCLDNESFRYLAALKQNVDLSNTSSFIDSWEHSVKECHRLIKYVTGEGATKIMPHQVSKTISVNKARQVIIELSKPLADITELIDDNVHVLQKHQKTLQIDNTSIETLKSQLYVPIVRLEEIECKQPKTVCANSKCCETIAVGDLKKLHYKQRCHDPCYLTNVAREIIGDKGLVHCAAMNGSGQCKFCHCDFSAHMHIYYETRTVNDKIEGSGIKAQIVDRETAVEQTKRTMRDIEKRKNEFEAEKKIIVRAIAKFAHFLERNAISPFNDSYKAYIEYLIKRESSRGPDCCVQTVQSLEKLLKQYDEEKKVLEDALKTSTVVQNITPDMILRQIQELYALRRTGQMIRNLHNLQKRGEASEYKNTEFVLPKCDPYDSDSSRGKIAGKGNHGKNKGKGGNQKGKGNGKVNVVHEENKFKNNKRGGPQNQFGKDKFQNPKFKREFQNNLNYQTNPQGNWRQNAGFPLHYQGNQNIQHPPPYYQNAFQGNSTNYQNPPQFNTGYNNFPPPYSTNYQNIPPNINQYQWYQDPRQQSFPGYNPQYQPSQGSYERNPSPPRNNSMPQQQQQYNKNYNKFVKNKLDASEEYDELYGDKKESAKTVKETNDYYSKDSDSDNESNAGFESFRKRKGLDKQRGNYNDLYGDPDSGNDRNDYGLLRGGGSLFNTMKNYFK